MWRYVGSLVAAGLVCSVCQITTADEGHDLLRYYSWWEGDWKIEVKEGDEVASAAMTVERHGDLCHIVKNGGIAIWGYDPETKRWVGTGIHADGGRFRTVLELQKGDKIKPGAVDKGRSEVWSKDGTKTISETVWTYIDDNTVKMHATQKTADGEKLPDTVTTATRVD